jgi:NADH-quinone oxidoreductase subunit E
MISGIGSEDRRHPAFDLGIWRFAQIAAWNKAERDWIDGSFEVQGTYRSRALGPAGGRRWPRAVVDEYVRVFGKKPR